MNNAAVQTSGDADPQSGVRRAETLDEFARRYTERAQGWLLFLGVPQFDAEDLVQEALLALCLCHAKVPTERRPAWLHSTVLRLDWARRRAWCLSQKHLPRATWEIELDHEHETSNELPATQLEREEVGALVERLFHRLRRERQTVVALFLFEELPMPRVAEHLRVNENTAWTYWERAKKDLRAIIEAERKREGFKAAGAFSLGVLLTLFARGWARVRRGVVPLAAVAAPAILAAGYVAMRAPVCITAHSAELRLDRTDPLEYAFKPFLTAPAERERDRTGAAPPSGSAAPPTGRDRRLLAARAHLVGADAALYVDHDRAKARTILAWYEAAFPENPFPEHYASLAAALRQP